MKSKDGKYYITTKKDRRSVETDLDHLKNELKKKGFVLGCFVISDLGSSREIRLPNSNSSCQEEIGTPLNSSYQGEIIKPFFTKPYIHIGKDAGELDNFARDYCPVP